MREEHDSLLPDAHQSNPDTDVSEIQVEFPIGDVRREDRDELINVAAETEQVSQQAAFSANDTVAQGTLVESDDVGEWSVQSQGGESSEERDDDFVDIMDVASSTVDMTSDIVTPAATKTYKQRKKSELSNINIRPPSSSLKTMGQRARIPSVAAGTPPSDWMLYYENNNLGYCVRKPKSDWNNNYRRNCPFHYKKRRRH
ncbi:hypothetical protein K7X08_009901 [Anisodus acutangulus]|uniref:Uncharacterized protein n=1 Tax=Anisodus acutangulus TaxID=402998 RepID=A0A9Q1N0P9_9SOLA|nr:hypothetical protein K7X08_009901 [Anisodus acutangulus]